MCMAFLSSQKRKLEDRGFTFGLFWMLGLGMIGLPALWACEQDCATIELTYWFFFSCGLVPVIINAVLLLRPKRSKD